jgi:hypothetical protein
MATSCHGSIFPWQSRQKRTPLSTAIKRVLGKFSQPMIVSEVVSPNSDVELKRKLLSLEIQQLVVKIFTKFTSLAFMYLATKIILRYTAQVLKSVADLSIPPKNIDEDLSSFFRPNITLSNPEMDILQNVVHPDSIKDTWNDLGGLKPIKTAINSLIFLDMPDRQNLLSEFPYLKLCKSMLLYGPPGCGKTSLIRGFCKQLNCPMIQITPSSIQRKYYGESNQLLKAVFTLAMKFKYCVILIDEIDSLFGVRKAHDHEHDRQIKTECK